MAKIYVIEVYDKWYSANRLSILDGGIRNEDQLVCILMNCLAFWIVKK